MATVEAQAIVPGGIEPPEDIPPEIFHAALRTHLAGRRLDMRALAAELGMGRATLYRKVGNRDHLLGSVIWFLSRRALARALLVGEALRGRERVVRIVEEFMTTVNTSPELRRFLEAEPEAALRILTSKQAPVQRGVVGTLERVLEQEERRGTLNVGIDHSTLAYAIVRIGEGFLYADVIADNPPDVPTAVEVVRRLLREE
jgi:AcrR family transcriptional regulator